MKRKITLRGLNHIVLKSKQPVLRSKHLLVKSIIKETETRFGVNFKEVAIMENHIHFLMKAPSRVAFANALRFLAGQIALKVRKGKLWIKRAWSRVVEARRDYLHTRKYIQMNPVKAGIFCEVDFWPRP